MFVTGWMYNQTTKLGFYASKCKLREIFSSVVTACKSWCVELLWRTPLKGACENAAPRVHDTDRCPWGLLPEGSLGVDTTFWGATGHGTVLVAHGGTATTASSLAASGCSCTCGRSYPPWCSCHSCCTSSGVVDLNRYQRKLLERWAETWAVTTPLQFVSLPMGMANGFCHSFTSSINGYLLLQTTSSVQQLCLPWADSPVE